MDCGLVLSRESRRGIKLFTVALICPGLSIVCSPTECIEVFKIRPSLMEVWIKLWHR